MGPGCHLEAGTDWEGGSGRRIVGAMSNATPLPVIVEQDGPFAGIATLVLEQPGKPVVVLELELLQRLEATLNSLPRNLRGLVLASASERVFVAGADLKAIMAMGDAQLDAYLIYGSKIYGMLGQLPYWTCAAINGAALGGGLELAMHCDGLVASIGPKPFPIGLPEAGLKICPGWGGTNLFPARVKDASQAIRLTAVGKPFLANEAVDAGLFDAVSTDGTKAVELAKQWIGAKVNTGSPTPPPVRDGMPSRWIGRTPGETTRVLKALDAVRSEVSSTEPGEAVARAIDAGLAKGWQTALAVERERLIYLRNTEGGKAAIEAFFAKSAAPKG